jgi:hypothetical protein
MLKKAASFVLASFKPSTGTRPPHISAARTNVVLLIRRTVRPKEYASGFHLLRPCWTDFLSILQGQFLLPARSFFPQARIKTLQVLRATLGPVLDE